MAPMKRPATSRDNVYGHTLSVPAVARLLGMSRKAVRRLMGAGRLNFTQICGRLRVSHGDAQRLAGELRREK